MANTVYLLSKVLEELDKNDMLVETVNLSGDGFICYPYTDSRELKKNNSQSDGLKTFICITGYETDGHKFASQAVTNGAGLIFSERVIEELSVPMVIVKNSRRALAIIAKLFFQDPSSKFYLIGVTGTNGKTSIVKILEKIMSSQLSLLGKRPAIATVGTLGYTINGVEYPLDKTTPDITELHQLFQRFVQEKIEYVIMEVSSHALKLDRVFGISFDCALFTNLSREHLDFHPDMEDYFESKTLLFDYLYANNGRAIININDDYGKKIFDTYKGNKIGLSDLADGCEAMAKSDLISYRVISQTLHKTKIEIDYTNCFAIGHTNKRLFETELIGKHNAFNVVAALTTALCTYQENASVESNFNMEKTFKNAISSLPVSIKGRLQPVDSLSPVKCLIDFAHTPNALETACQTLKKIIWETWAAKSYSSHSFLEVPPRLICVFGAGGNRDKGKRPEMTKAALKYADMTIITSDNPREENCVDIIFDLIEETHPLSPYWIVTDRKKAIETAVKIASDNDLILIAGKGHEQYQIIGKEKHYFDDYQVAQEALNRRKADIESSDERLKVNQMDGHYQESRMTTQLVLPIDIVQLQLLLTYCSEKDLAANRWGVEQLAVSTDKMKNIRERIVKLIGDQTHSTKDIPMIEYISSDTRTIHNKSLFFALRGDYFDGHQYVEIALKNKGNYAVVDRYLSSANGHAEDKDKLIETDNPLISLAILAKKYKTLFNNYTIALTGSTGKTSTKEYVYNVLSQSKRTLKNISNENNIIGIARTILNLDSSFQFLILEAGTSQKGEMQVIADTCQPDIGIITNIGPCHLKAFDTIQGVYEEKLSLINRSLMHTIFPEELSFDSEKGNRWKLIREKEKNTDRCSFYRLTSDNRALGELSYTISKENDDQETSAKCKQDVNNFSMPTDIDFLIDNAAVAVAVGKLVGIDNKTINQAFSKRLSLPNRMDIRQLTDRCIIFDCYNANPVSMKAAIEYWANLHPEMKHIAVLGDMLELGQETPRFHKEVGDFFKKHTATKPYQTVLITVGNNARLYDGDYHFDNVEKLIEAEKQGQLLMSSQSVVLIKASRGLKLEKVKPFIVNNLHKTGLDKQ